MNRLKYIILFVILFVSYLVYPNLIVLLMQLLNIPYTEFSNLATSILEIAISFSYLVILFLIYRKTLVKEFKEFIVLAKTDFFKWAKVWLLGVAIMFISNIIIFQIYPTNASNEIAVQNMFVDNPIYIFISAVLLAPFAEEMIFRKGMRNIFKSPYTYILASGILFGYIHTLANPTDLMELLYIIPYGTVGACFAYLYQKHENVFIPTCFHMIHNFISLFFSFLAYFIF